MGLHWKEVIDSVFAKTPTYSPVVLSALKNALLRPCAVALIKVFLHNPVQGQCFSVPLFQQVVVAC